MKELVFEFSGDFLKKHLYLRYLSFIAWAPATRVWVFAGVWKNVIRISTLSYSRPKAGKKACLKAYGKDKVRVVLSLYIYAYHYYWNRLENHQNSKARPLAEFWFAHPFQYLCFACPNSCLVSYKSFWGLKSLPVIRSRLIRLWIPCLNDENDSIKGCCQADYVEGHLDSENIINISALFGLLFEIVYCILILDKMNFDLFLKKFQVYAVNSKMQFLNRVTVTQCYQRLSYNKIPTMVTMFPKVKPSAANSRRRIAITLVKDPRNIRVHPYRLDTFRSKTLWIIGYNVRGSLTLSLTKVFLCIMCHWVNKNIAKIAVRSNPRTQLKYPRP